MSKIRYISQTQETECGLCCIAMILNYFGCDILPREMKESKDIGRDGLSLQQIKNIFNNYKVDVDIYEAGINRLPEILGTPVILYWDNSHFVILKKIVKNKYFITDPAIGDCILSKEQFSEKYSNLTLVSSPQKNFEKILNKRSNFKIFVKYFSEHRFNFISLIILSLIFSLSSLFVPMYISQISERFTNNMFKSDPLLLSIIFLIPSFILVYFLRAQIVLKNIKEMDLSNYNTITKKLFELPFFYFKSRNSSTILFRLSLLKNNRELILDTISSGLLDILMIFVLLVAIAINNIESLVVVIIFSCIFGTSLYFLRKKLLIQYKSELSKYTQLQSLEYETFSSLFSIKASAHESYMHTILQQKNKEALDFFVKRNAITNIYSTVVYFISTFGAISVLLITLILSTHTFNTSQLIFMFTVSGVYFSSFSTLFDTINTIGLLKNNMLHVNDILEQNIEEDNNIKVDIEKVDEIEFKNVYFKYPGQSDYILKNISFTIDNNKKIGIVGQTGSGKSTIVGLLLGIYT
ncbi:TPA: ATP-binding cassette domain-containing protein, partial [Staphylococcus aureus]|nr:ATP-binding cassette domain-containing protein [Staphylococcus aureus]